MNGRSEGIWACGHFELCCWCCCAAVLFVFGSYRRWDIESALAERGCSLGLSASCRRLLVMARLAACNVSASSS
jgi:hypothetical protein